MTLKESGPQRRYFRERLKARPHRAFVF